MLSEASGYLAHTWSFDMKSDSHVYMSGLGNDQHDPSQISDLWKETNVFTVLGHRLAANGSCDPCISVTINSAWRAFWSNVSSSTNSVRFLAVSSQSCLLGGHDGHGPSRLPGN